MTCADPDGCDRDAYAKGLCRRHYDCRRRVTEKDPRRYKFTPAVWAKWMARQDWATDVQAKRLREGIEELRIALDMPRLPERVMTQVQQSVRLAVDQAFERINGRARIE